MTDGCRGERTEFWRFQIIDVIAVLSESINPRDYWFRMMVRVKAEDGLELSTEGSLMMPSWDSVSLKMQHTSIACDVATIKIQCHFFAHYRGYG